MNPLSRRAHTEPGFVSFFHVWFLVLLHLHRDLIPAVCMGASGAGVGVAAHQLMIIRTEHEYDSMVAEMRGDSEAQTDDVDEALAPPPPRGTDTAPSACRLLLVVIVVPLLMSMVGLWCVAEDYLFHDTAHSRHASISADRAIVSMKSWGSALLQYPIMKPGTGIHLFRFKVLQVSMRRFALSVFETLAGSYWQPLTCHCGNCPCSVLRVAECA